MHTFNSQFHSITHKILKHLRCSLQGDCECLDPYHVNPRSIEGKLGTVQFSCCSSACYRHNSVTDTLPRSYFCYFCHQGHGLFYGVPICVHAVAVFKLSIVYISHHSPRLTPYGFTTKGSPRFSGSTLYLL